MYAYVHVGTCSSCAGKTHHPFPLRRVPFQGMVSIKVYLTVSLKVYLTVSLKVYLKVSLEVSIEVSFKTYDTILLP